MTHSWAEVAAALRALANAIDPSDETVAPTAAPEPERLLTYPEVAERLGVGESFARRLGKRGAFPEVRLGSLRCVRVRARDIDAYIQLRAVAKPGRRIA